MKLHENVSSADRQTDRHDAAHSRPFVILKKRLKLVKKSTLCNYGSCSSTV